MLPRTLIATADIPGGGQLRLIRRGDEFSIMLGATELMNSRLSGSEEALAALALAGLGADARLLIGGLGMGFTLRAALPRLGPAARVTVAELVPAVADWARGEMAALFGDSLADSRVTLHIGDVHALITAAPQAWDAILLDVDNGPDGLTVAANDRLYAAAGLAAARAALRPGGVLAIWSSGADAGFSRRLAAAGFAVEERPVRAHKGRGGHHHIWLGRRG